MENLAYYNDDVYAIIDSNNKIMDVIDDYDEAYEIAYNCGAKCIETLADYNGSSYQVVDRVWIEQPDLIKQKILAVVMIILSIFTVFILDGDATFAAVMIPLMVYLLFTKEYWLN